MNMVRASWAEVVAHVDKTNPHHGARDAWGGIGRDSPQLLWSVGVVSISRLPEVHPASSRDVKRYAKHAQKTKGEFPAIVISCRSNKIIILDGAHRLAAARMLGHGTIRAYVGVVPDAGPACDALLAQGEISVTPERRNPTSETTERVRCLTLSWLRKRGLSEGIEFYTPEEWRGEFGRSGDDAAVSLVMGEPLMALYDAAQAGDVGARRRVEGLEREAMENGFTVERRATTGLHVVPLSVDEYGDTIEVRRPGWLGEALAWVVRAAQA
jgi:hypothetical protein